MSIDYPTEHDAGSWAIALSRIPWVEGPPDTFHNVAGQDANREGFVSPFHDQSTTDNGALNHGG